jgi:hypothetical protein
MTPDDEEEKLIHQHLEPPVDGPSAPGHSTGPGPQTSSPTGAPHVGGLPDEFPSVTYYAVCPSHTHESWQGEFQQFHDDAKRDADEHNAVCEQRGAYVESAPVGGS